MWLFNTALRNAFKWDVLLDVGIVGLGPGAGGPVSRIILFQISFFFFATEGWEYDGMQTTTPMDGVVSEEIRWAILQDYNAAACASGWPNVATAGQFVWNATEQNQQLIPAAQNAWETIQRNPNHAGSGRRRDADNVQQAITEAMQKISQ